MQRDPVDLPGGGRGDPSGPGLWLRVRDRVPGQAGGRVPLQAPPGLPGPVQTERHHNSYKVSLDLYDMKLTVSITFNEFKIRKEKKIYPLWRSKQRHGVNCPPLQYY